MKEKLVEEFEKEYKKKDLPEIRPGDLVRVYHKIKEGDKEKVHHFEGIVIAKKRKKEIGATITVRREISGIGVEKIFPLHSPLIEKIEILKRQKVRRAKLYYLRKK
jgi:large subunit ribosomal protein L19